MLTGSIVAIVSPMTEEGRLDLAAFRRLIDWHIEEGTDGVVVVGTTGESPTVDVEEHSQLIRTAVEHAAKRIPIIAGTGGNSGYVFVGSALLQQAHPRRALSALSRDRRVSKYVHFFV
jgi:dihydrodipicolinate synthase/N-acetylneuraminate lyase